MCEFISAVEKKEAGKLRVYFLTGKQVYDTPRGKMLQEHSLNIEDDKLGHGAIRFYYDIEGGTDKEYTDFSSPANFPAVIAKAIKRGDMRRMASVPQHLLLKPLYDKYLADRKALYDKYEADRKPLYDKYEADLKPLYDKYLADRKPLYDKYEADRKALYDKYWADRKPLYDKYRADRKALDDKYWDLFANPDNRKPAWR